MYLFVITYSDGTKKEYFTETPSFPHELHIDATSYKCFSSDGRVSYHRYGYPTPNDREESWYWVMNLPMTAKEKDRLKSFKYSCVVCGEPHFEGQRHICFQESMKAHPLR